MLTFRYVRSIMIAKPPSGALWQPVALRTLKVIGADISFSNSHNYKTPSNLNQQGFQGFCT